jgi:mRNA-degrading endonuclease RelE of RelBE toxin-antitoxin system
MGKQMVIIESPLFTRLIANYLSDDEYSALQWGLATHPELGDVLPGSGGIRKLRWAGSGRGKRGGLRAIYYWRNNRDEVWLLTVYAKNEAENIPASTLKTIKKEIEK